MMPFRTLAALFVAAVLCSAGLSCEPKYFTNRAEGGFDADNFFPIMPWEIHPEKQGFLDEPGHGIESLRECGFTAVAFVTPAQLKRCEQLGLRAIVGRPSGRVNWRDMSDEAIFEYVKTAVDSAGESDALLGYFLTDEPNVRDFPALGKAVAAVKKLAPGKLAYINLYPNYATLGAPDLSQLGTEDYTEYLERYVSEVNPQFISYDNYHVQLSMDLADRDKATKYYTNLLEVRRVAQKHDLPFWNIVNANQIRPHTTVPSPANLLFQAYTTLAAGGRGLTWFTYYAGTYQTAPIDKAGNRTVIWSHLKMVNDQVKTLGPILARMHSTGVFFTSPAPYDGAPPLPGNLVESIESATPVMIGEFSGTGDDRYVMLVNLSLERSSKLIIKTKYRRLENVSPVDGSLTTVPDDRSLWLVAGQGALLKVR